MRSLLSFILLFAFLSQANGESPISANVIFNIQYNGNTISGNEDALTVSSSDSTHFETIKFYVSNVRLLKGTKIVFTEINSYHLIDLSKASSLNLSLQLPAKITYDQIYFDLGIDSTTNSGGVKGGNLDPTNGMYWTWQSGYVNFKIEATVPSSNAPGKEFSIHLGGYSFPENALRTIKLNVMNTSNINIGLDLKKFLEAADAKKMSHVMSPGIKSVELSTELAKCFYIK